MGIFERLRQALPGGRSGNHSGPDRPGPDDSGRFEDGERRLSLEEASRLVDLARSRHGERHPEYASAITGLALLHQEAGEIDAAEPLLRQAVAVYEEVVGPQAPEYAKALARLAGLLRLKGDPTAAEPLVAKRRRFP